MRMSEAKDKMRLTIGTHIIFSHWMALSDWQTLLSVSNVNVI